MRDPGAIETRTILVPGAELHAEFTGGQPRSIFVHGFGGDLHLWDGLWPPAGHPAGCLRYDLRGFGQSPELGSGSFSHGDDLLALLDAMDIECADLVGVSMGARIALTFALDHPERVGRLVLISPGLIGWDWSDEWRALWRPIERLAREGKFEEAKQLWWEHPLFATTRASPSAPVLQAAIRRSSGRHFAVSNERPAPPDVERLHLLRPPTLLLTGQCDFPDFRLVADLIEGACSQVRRVDFAGRGHVLHLEEPERCAVLIASFLETGPMEKA